MYIDIHLKYLGIWLGPSHPALVRDRVTISSLKRIRLIVETVQSLSSDWTVPGCGVLVVVHSLCLFDYRWVNWSATFVPTPESVHSSAVCAATPAETHTSWRDTWGHTQVKGRFWGLTDNCPSNIRSDLKNTSSVTPERRLCHRRHQFASYGIQIFVPLETFGLLTKFRE